MDVKRETILVSLHFVYAKDLKILKNDTYICQLIAHFRYYIRYQQFYFLPPNTPSTLWRQMCLPNYLLVGNAGKGVKWPPTDRSENKKISRTIHDIWTCLTANLPQKVREESKMRRPVQSQVKSMSDNKIYRTSAPTRLRTHLTPFPFSNPKPHTHTHANPKMFNFFVFWFS
jgi:hypothetical protein